MGGVASRGGERSCSSLVGRDFTLALLTGVCIRTFHPHPNPLTPRRIYDPEGERVCWLVLMPKGAHKGHPYGRATYKPDTASV